MKAKSILTGIMILAAAVVSGSLRAQSMIALPLITSDQYLIVGEVTARSDIDLTIVSPASKVETIQVSDSTAITKGGITLKLSDIMVGDKVKATVMRGGNGTLQAVTITVLAGDE